MQKNLRDGGVSARMDETKSSGGARYRVLVSLKGTPEDTRALRSKLASYGIRTVILRGKTPVK
jgi:hypothetical protein